MNEYMEELLKNSLRKQRSVLRPPREFLAGNDSDYYGFSDGFEVCHATLIPLLSEALPYVISALKEAQKLTAHEAAKPEILIRCIKQVTEE